GSDCRPDRADPSLFGQAGDRLAVCDEGYPGVAAELEEARLENRLERAGEECRPLAKAGRGSESPPGELAVGAWTYRASGQRASGPVGQSRRRRSAFGELAMCWLS